LLDRRSAQGSYDRTKSQCKNLKVHDVEHFSGAVNPVDECPICRRPRDPELEFCKLHFIAASNLERQFESWRIACGGKLEKAYYFEQVRNLAETGGAVKKVIDFMRNKSATS
jgi:hypothetical protein